MEALGLTEAEGLCDGETLGDLEADGLTEELGDWEGLTLGLLLALGLTEEEGETDGDSEEVTALVSNPFTKVKVNPPTVKVRVLPIVTALIVLGSETLS